MKYCLPALVYLALTLFSLLLTFTSNAFTPGSATSVSIFHVIFSILWFFFLNWLCSKGLSRLSWFLVLFPFIIIIVALFILAGTLARSNTVLVYEEDRSYTIPVLSSAAGTPVVHQEHE